MISISDLFEAAAKKLAEPGAWSPNFTARRPSDIKGVEGDMSCLATDRRAQSFGLQGALFAAGRAQGLRNADCYSAARTLAYHLGADLRDWSAKPGRRQSEAVEALNAAAAAERMRAAA